MQDTTQRLAGKVALVTGASRGIGRAIAERFADHGCQVAFSYLSSIRAGETLEKQLLETKVKAKGYCSDASDFSSAEMLIQAVLEDFGRLDILVNNAGVTRDNLLLRMEEAAWDDVLRINLKSCFHTVRAATRSFMKQKSGSIINITSIVGLRGNAGQANYAASKAGIIGFTKSVALELGARNIRCNAIAPGLIATDMTDAIDEQQRQAWAQSIPLRRIGEATEIADACVFLASEEAKYITGQVLQVDGGMLT